VVFGRFSIIDAPVVNRAKDTKKKKSLQGEKNIEEIPAKILIK
jgi:hypothetical protein